MAVYCQSTQPMSFFCDLEFIFSCCSRVGAENVVNFVVELLVGRECLLEGFSQFLPPACRESLLDRFSSGNSPSPATKKPKSTHKRSSSSSFDSVSHRFLSSNLSAFPLRIHHTPDHKNFPVKSLSSFLFMAILKICHSKHLSWFHTVMCPCTLSLVPCETLWATMVFKLSNQLRIF